MKTALVGFATGEGSLQVFGLAAPFWPRAIARLLAVRSWEEVIGAALIALAAGVLGRGCAWVLVGVLKRWSRRTLTPVDDIVVNHLSRPLAWLGPLVALIWVLPLLDLEADREAGFRHLLVVLAILAVGFLFMGLVESGKEIAGQRLASGHANSTAARSSYSQMQNLANIASFLIVIVTLGLALLSFTGVRELGVSLLASAGVVGVVIGFAAQRAISTVLSGLVIALAQPIRINDTVFVEGETGVIEEIGLTHVVVRLWDFRRQILPVGYFLERPFQNWSRSQTQLFASVLLSFDYSVSIEAVREELRRILEASQAWDHRSWKLEVTDASERALLVRAAMTAADADRAWELRCEVREKLLAFVQQQYPSALPRARNETVTFSAPS